MKRKALKFLVHWKGYPVKERTWEPLDYVKECDAFQEYLLKHPELEDQIQKKGSVMVNHRHSPETEGTPEDPGRSMERIQDETKRRKEKRKIRR